MNRTLLDECFRVEGRKTWQSIPDEIQRDLDRFMAYYNLHRSHQGYRLRGRTPAQAPMGALDVSKLPPVVPEFEEDETQEAAQTPHLSRGRAPTPGLTGRDSGENRVPRMDSSTRRSNCVEL